MTHRSISAMPQSQGKSQEEIRWEDVQAGRLVAQASRHITPDSCCCCRSISVLQVEKSSVRRQRLVAQAPGLPLAMSLASGPPPCCVALATRLTNTGPHNNRAGSSVIRFRRHSVWRDDLLSFRLHIGHVPVWRSAGDAGAMLTAASPLHPSTREPSHCLLPLSGPLRRPLA